MKKILFWPLAVLVLAGAFAAWYLLRAPPAAKAPGGGTGAPKTVVLYNWAAYIDPAVLVEFEAETGIKVIEEIADSNETMRSKLIAGADGYDIMVPSSQMVQALVREGLLAPLDLGRIPNRKHLDPAFLGRYWDPQNTYSLPYLFGSAGIAYRPDKLGKAPESWADIFEPERIALWRGRISMLDDPRESLGVALKYLGFSANTKDARQLEKAKDVLVRQKPFLARYDNETFAEFLASGDLSLAFGWGGAIAKVRRDGAGVKYVIPREGGVTSVDSFCIPKSARHKREAEDLIDFLLRPEINARIVNLVRYPSANAGARKYILPEVLGDESLYPSPEAAQKLEWIEDVREASVLYERAWNEVKLSRE